MKESNERTQTRDTLRTSLVRQGPQHLPAELRDENFHYRWVNYIPDSPWKALEAERIGYEPVLATEVLQTKSKVFASRTSTVDGYYTCPIKGGGDAVLMKLPIKTYLEREAAKVAERRAENIKGLEITESGSKNFTFTNKL